MTLPFNLPAIPPRLRRPLLIAGYVSFALTVAVLTLYGTLPRERIKDRLEVALSADPSPMQPLGIGMDVTIGDVGLTLLTGAGVHGKDLVLRTRPLNPTDKPTRYLIDDATVHLGLIGLWLNRPNYSWKGHALGGTITGAYRARSDESHLELEGHGLALGGSPGLQTPLGLPLEGTLRFAFDVTSPKQLLGNSDGKIELTIEDAAIGDGKAKLTIAGDPFLSQGVTFPKIKLGRLSGQVIIDKGRARLDGVELRSGEVDALLDGYVELRDPIGISQLHGYLRFRPSETLTKREPTIELMLNALQGSAKRSDGYLGFQVTGSFSLPAFIPSREPPTGVSAKPAEVAAPPPAAAPAPLPPPPVPPTHVLAPPPAPPEEPPPPPPPPPAPVAAPTTTVPPPNPPPAPPAAPPPAAPPTERHAHPDHEAPAAEPEAKPEAKPE